MVQNRQGEVKNTMGSGESKELVCTTHGHELRGAGMQVGEGRWERLCRVEVNKGGEMGQL